MSEWGRLSPVQQAWALEHLGTAEVVRDMSWNLVESIVLHVRTSAGDVVVKAGDANNHHIARELSAHPRHTGPLVASGHAARLRAADADLRVMILDHLPGQLLEGTDAEQQPAAYEQAGALLRRLHEQETREDAEYWTRTIARALSWLDKPNRLDAEASAEARRILLSSCLTSAAVVPTHGDWQPRNWLIDGDVVRVIDFGRFGFRPAATDLTRLAAKQWRNRPDLESAFFAGYGNDPRERNHWRLERLQEAVGTACWAFAVGDVEFEAQGHRMLAEILSEF